MADNDYGTPIPFGQTADRAQSVIDTAILVWEQMGLSTAQIMYGIAMMNVESGDIPTKPNGVDTSTIRGLGQFSDGTWDDTAKEFDRTYGLSPGSINYIPQDLGYRVPTNANFNPAQPAGTNAQSAESNDPTAGQYDPEGLVEQLEVVGQGIINEWNLATKQLTQLNGSAGLAVQSLVSQGAAGAFNFNPNSPGSSALLATVALAYLGHHEGLSWWTSQHKVAHTSSDLKNGAANAITRVLDAFRQEFKYLSNQAATSSALSGLTATTVTSADLESISSSALLIGDPWQLAGAEPASIITNNIPSIAGYPDDFLSQTAGGLSSYTVTSTGRVTSYTYTANGTGASDVVSGSATFNFDTDTGSGVQTLANGNVVSYTESMSVNSVSATETTTDPSGAVVNTETETRDYLDGYEESSHVFYKGSTLQVAYLGELDLLRQTQIQGVYDSSSQLIEIDFSSAFGSQKQSILQTDPDFAQAAQRYGLPMVDQFTSPGVSNVSALLNAQGVSALSSLNGLSSARASVDPGFQADAALSDGSTLAWQFNPDGTISSRDIVGTDGSSQDDLFGASGQYVGTSVTTSGGDGSTVTTTYSTSGAETGYSTSATYDPGSTLSINGVSTTYANGFTITTQYDAPGADGTSAILSFSVSSLVENADGTSTTTETDYRPQANPDGSITDVLTGSTVTITSANQSTSADYDANGNVTGSRALTQNSDGSVTVQNFDSSGALTGSETLSMDSGGDTTLQSYGASGQLTDGKTLTVTGTLTDTMYSDGTVSGESVSAPTAEGGNLTTYLAVNGSVTGDAWVNPDGTYGSDTVQAGGASAGTTHYTDSTWSSSVNDGRGDVTTTDYNASGVVTGGSKSTIGSSGVTVDYTSSDDLTASSALFGSDGSSRATVAGSSGSSVGISLGIADDFSRIQTDSEGVTTATVLDGDGNVTGTSATSLVDGGVMTVSYDPSGTETGYSLKTSSNGIVTTTFYSGTGGQFVETGYDQEVTNSDGSMTTTDYSEVNGTATETEYTTSATDTNGATTTTSYIQNPNGDGSFVENGRTIVSVNSQGMVTKDELDAKGNLLNYVSERIDGAGDALVSEYDGTGALVQESTVSATGVVTSILANTANGTVTTTWQPDATYQQTTDDGEGDVTTISYSPIGVALSDTWSGGDGSHGQDTLSSDGSSTGTAYNADGTYSTYSADSQGNTLTQNYDASGALQSVEDSLNDGQGDSVALSFDPSGHLTGQTWVTANGATDSESFSTQGTDFETNTAALTGARESITGPAQGGVIVGWGSQETLTAAAGQTLIDGVNSGDLIVGGTGSDTLEALAADSTLIGGSGNDLFEVNDPTDIVQAGNGQRFDSLVGQLYIAFWR